MPSKGHEMTCKVHGNSYSGHLGKSCNSSKKQLKVNHHFSKLKEIDEQESIDKIEIFASVLKREIFNFKIKHVDKSAFDPNVVEQKLRMLNHLIHDCKRIEEESNAALKLLIAMKAWKSKEDEKKEHNRMRYSSCLNDHLKGNSNAI